MKVITALTLRKKLGSILDEVVEKKEAVTVTRSNKPLVAIIPYEEYERREERTARLTKVAERMDRLRDKIREEIGEVDTTRMVRESRDER